MIPCPRWGWSGLCSQFCHAVLLAHIFLCIIFLRNSEWEGVQLNLRAGHRGGASNAQPHRPAWHSRKTSEQQRCPEVNVLSAAVGDSGADWAFLSNWHVSSGFASSQRTPAWGLGVLGGSSAVWTSTENMMSIWETQDLRQEHGGTALACAKQSWLSFIFWASFTWPNTMLWFHESPLLAEEMNAVNCYSSESARVGLGLPSNSCTGRVGMAACC